MEFDAVEEWGAATSVLVGFINGEPSRFPARDGKSAAEQRGRVRGLRVLAQFDAQRAPILGARRTVGERMQQHGHHQPKQTRTDAARDLPWWGRRGPRWAPLPIRAKLGLFSPRSPLPPHATPATVSPAPSFPPVFLSGNPYRGAAFQAGVPPGPPPF